MKRRRGITEGMHRLGLLGFVLCTVAAVALVATALYGWATWDAGAHYGGDDYRDHTFFERASIAAAIFAIGLFWYGCCRALAWVIAGFVGEVVPHALIEPPPIAGPGTHSTSTAPEALRNAGVVGFLIVCAIALVPYAMGEYVRYSAVPEMAGVNQIICARNETEASAKGVPLLGSKACDYSVSRLQRAARAGDVRVWRNYSGTAMVIGLAWYGLCVLAATIVTRRRRANIRT